MSDYFIDSRFIGNCVCCKVSNFRFGFHDSCDALLWFALRFLTYEREITLAEPLFLRDFRRDKALNSILKYRRSEKLARGGSHQDQNAKPHIKLSQSNFEAGLFTKPNKPLKH